MTRSTRIIAALVALVLLGMGYALFLVLGDVDDAGDARAPDDVARRGPDVSPSGAAADGGRRRAHHTGDCAIFGEVRRAEGGAPVVDQDVLLVDADAAETRTKTDASGAFRFAGIAAGGPYEVRVVAAGFAEVRLPGIALDRREERDVGTLQLDAAVPVTVRVRSLADAPIAEAEVRAYAAPQMSAGFDWSKALAQLGQEPIPVARASTDSSGTATFDGLAAGTWSFVAVKQGFARSGKTSVRLRAREPAEPITLHMGRGFPLVGRVIDEDGAPISGALVLGATDQNPFDIGSAPLRARSTTGDDGRYALESLPSGDVSLWAARAGGVPAALVIVRVPDVESIDLTLKEGGTLTGLVTVQGTGEPVAGAMVRTWGGQTMSTAESDAEGRYSIQAPGEGVVSDVQVTKEGYFQVRAEGPQAPLDVRRGTTVQRDIELAVGATLTGTVRGPSGPVAGARVTVVFSSPQRGFEQRQATADGQGSYRVVGLQEGSAHVFATAPGLYTPGFGDNWWMALQSNSAPEETKVEIAVETDNRHDVVLAAGGHVAGRVETLEGEPIAGARVSVSSPMNWGQDVADGVLSDADGNFRIDGVSPTQQMLVAARKQGLVATKSEPIALAEGESRDDVVVRLVPPPVVRGRVSLGGDAPPTETYVRVTVTPEPAMGAVFFDPSSFMRPGERHPVRADGTYEVTLSAVVGQLVVEAAAPGHAATVSEPLKLDAGQAEYTVDVALGPGVGFEGRVIDATTRAAIPGARIRLTAKRDPRANGQVMVTGLMGWGASAGGGSGAVVAITDAAGRFRIEGVAKGDYQVGAEAEGYVTGSTDARVPGTGSLDVPLAPELEIRGVVSWADGTPVAGVSVSAGAGGPQGGMMRMPRGRGVSQSGGTATTDGQGAFVIRGLADGSYAMSVANAWMGKANFLPYEGAEVAAGTADARIVLRVGMRIAGTVVDGAGKPVAGAWIWANPMKPEPGKPFANSNAQSAADGSFELVGLAASESGYRVQVSVQSGMGGATAQPVTLEDVQAGTTGLRVVLLAGLSIEGVIVDESGTALTNAWISALPIREGGQALRGAGQAMIGAGGKFIIGGLGAGPYRLELQTWGSGQSQRLVVIGGDSVPAGASGLRLTASKGAVISGVVVDGSGAPVAGVQVAARTEQGQGGSAVSGGDGTFELSGLDAGTQYIVAAMAQGKLGSQVVGIPGDASGLRLVVEDGVECSGRALDADGVPLARISLRLNPQSDPGTMPQGGTTDEDGGFRIGGLAQGVVYRVQGRIRADGRRENLDLGTITGGASGATLQPVAK